MTDTPKKPRELTAEQFIARIRRRAATFDDRRSEHLHEADLAFRKRENAYRCNSLAIVAERERPAAVKMAEMLGLEIDEVPLEPPTEPTEPGQSSAATSPEPSAPDDGIPERLKTEVPGLRPGERIDPEARRVGKARA